jgi:hypothetical protein
MDETVTVRKRADESARKSHIGPGEESGLRSALEVNRRWSRAWISNATLV